MESGSGRKKAEEKLKLGLLVWESKKNGGSSLCTGGGGFQGKGNGERGKIST